MQAPPSISTAIVQKAAKGNTDAQALLYRQYGKAMFNICMRMAGNRSDAEDLLQDAFILAFDKLPQLKQPESFGGWLRRIVVNECIRFCKTTITWGDWDETHHNTLANEPVEWWTTINLDVVHQQIKSLPEGCRQVFVLYVLEDFAHKDIAANLGISESTSKSQYHRAKQLLKERITQQMTIHG